jgi:hypothetical protein
VKFDTDDKLSLQHFDMKKTFIAPLLIVSTLILSLFNCQTPLEPPDTSSDYTEFESVWQHLKAYSIYQDRIPPDPFVFSSPEALLFSIGDTLKGSSIGYSYTRYLYSSEIPAWAASAAAATVLAGPTTVFLDTLTDSTALLTIWTFDTSTYNDFYLCAYAASSFPNLVINLRNNRGGYLDQSDAVIGALVPEGTAYVQARQRDYDRDAKKFLTLDWHALTAPHNPLTGLFQGKKYAVLMNGMTASASEIVAAALWEGAHSQGGRTWLIGERSYGKGIGQAELFRRGRKPMKITFLQLKGVNPRIGDYRWHPGDTVSGIVPDTVSSALIQQADSIPSLSDPYRRDIFYAVKILEPGASSSFISSIPPEGQRDSLGLHKTALSGLSKVIYEE